MYNIFEPWLKQNGYTVTDLPLTAEWYTGEPVIVEVTGKDESGNWIWKLSTAQDNGWMRITYYYADGTVEELYEQ